MRARSRLIATGALALVAAGCGDRGAPAPARAATAIFDLARAGEPDLAAVERAFGPTRDPAARAALLDLLARIGRTSEVRVLGIEPLADGWVAVDLSGITGGAEARFTVHLEQMGRNEFAVRYVAGPGLEWPPAGKGAGSGLSSFPPL